MYSAAVLLACQWKKIENQKILPLRVAPRFSPSTGFDTLSSRTPALFPLLGDDDVSLNLLLVFVPLAIVLRAFDADPMWTFAAAALGIAVTLWLLFVMVGDLGLMGSALVMKMTPGTLLGLTLANPLDVYKLAGVNLLQSSLEVLGPAGAYAIDRIGSTLTWLLLALLMIWVIAPLPIGYWLFRRTDFR